VPPALQEPQTALRACAPTAGSYSFLVLAHFGTSASRLGPTALRDFGNAENRGTEPGIEAGTEQEDLTMTSLEGALSADAPRYRPSVFAFRLATPCGAGAGSCVRAFARGAGRCMRAMAILLVEHRKAKAAEELYTRLSRCSDADLARRGLDRQQLGRFISDRLYSD
jgi:hypothetical protein